eukprot:9814442-Ditylum_brightwellii.AAC.1
MGVYKDACNEWRNKPDVKKTWPNFKIHFTAAYAGNLEEHTNQRLTLASDHDLWSDIISVETLPEVWVLCIA